METELLKKLSTDPALWPYYMFLAGITIFILKIINAAADAATKHLSEKVKKRKGLLSLSKVAAQVVMISLVIYISNAFYWSRAIDQLVPSPTSKPINTCETTVEIVIESDDKGDTHFMDTGGYLAFVHNDQPLLITAAPDSWGRSIAPKEYMYRGIFRMDATDTAVGKSVDMLRQTQYVQVGFQHITKDYSLIRGKALCVINSEVRFEFSFPAQRTLDGKVFVRDLEFLEKLLR